MMGAVTAAGSDPLRSVSHGAQASRRSLPLRGRNYSTLCAGLGQFHGSATGEVDIKIGDQVRARGARTGQAHGRRVIAGTFQTIAGLVISVDAGRATRGSPIWHRRKW